MENKGQNPKMKSSPGAPGLLIVRKDGVRFDTRRTRRSALERAVAEEHEPYLVALCRGLTHPS